MPCRDEGTGMHELFTDERRHERRLDDDYLRSRFARVVRGIVPLACRDMGGRNNDGHLRMGHRQVYGANPTGFANV